MKFDTAIFYDIENLIGGYGSRMDYISELSLKDILEEIQKMDDAVRIKLSSTVGEIDERVFLQIMK